MSERGLRVLRHYDNHDEVIVIMELTWRLCFEISTRVYLYRWISLSHIEIGRDDVSRDE